MFILNIFKLDIMCGLDDMGPLISRLNILRFGFALSSNKYRSNELSNLTSIG